MSFPRPSRCFSRNALKQLPRLQALRESISNLPGVSGSSSGAEKQPDSDSLSISHTHVPARHFFCHEQSEFSL